MMLQSILETFPPYAKDIKLNFSSLLNSETNLTQQQFWGTLLSCAMASKNKLLLNAISENAKSKLTDEAYSAAKSAAALMAMNNIYYRFTHLVSNTEYTRLPANLRMTTLAQPGIEKMDFELFSLAVSAINGCGMCMDAHEKILSKHGVSKENIQMAIRIAAIIYATATVLEADSVE
jgi:lipoyl-dependent peroxiredoxin subunit D